MTKPRKVGAVVIFKDGVTKEQASAMLSGLRAMVGGPSLLPPTVSAVESADVQTFNPEHGEPVFYIP